MKIIETALDGVFVIELEPARDDRGWFARAFDADVFASRGLQSTFVQHSISANVRAGTLRGLHYQVAPAEEVKIVRCTAGTIFDVVVDLRAGSKSFCRSFTAELSRENLRTLYIPKGCAHGFMTLTDNADVHYMISTPYEPALARGLRWNDPAFAIAWPREPAVISARDAAYPDFKSGQSA